MNDKKPKKRYKDIHGTTRVGDFLRSIGKSDVLNKVVGAVGEIATGDIMGAIDIITKSKELSPEEKEYALKMAEMDLVEMQEVTKRWESDMSSDSWLSKNIRPLVLAFLTLFFSTVLILDSSADSFSVREDWISLFSSLLLLVYGGYFGARTVEKVFKLRNS